MWKNIGVALADSYYLWKKEEKNGVALTDSYQLWKKKCGYKYWCGTD